VRIVDHLELDDGALIYEHACAIGCEGIVSKRVGSRYVSGRSRDWIKVKNPSAPAARRLADEDWNAHRPAGNPGRLEDRK
jgi:ATP-dependent DNA ligase